MKHTVQVTLAFLSTVVCASGAHAATIKPGRWLSRDAQFAGDRNYQVRTATKSPSSTFRRKADAGLSWSMERRSRSFAQTPFPAAVIWA